MLKNIFYINLEHRTDRKENVENELKKMGWNNYTRFNAIKHENGLVGCAMSHLKILKDAKENDLDYVVVIEDDIYFTQPKIFNDMMIDFLSTNINYDVLLLAGNLKSSINIYHHIHRATRSLTTTGYIVKKHYYDKLIKNIENGIKNLLIHPDKHYFFAIDTNWFKLQEDDTWLIFRPRTITQLPNYSDIEKKYVSYDRCMLDDINPKKISCKPCSFI